MSKNNVENEGIARIFKASVRSQILFGAVFQARIDNPTQSLTEIVARVLSNFKINMTVEAAIHRYNILLNDFLDNGGIG